MEKVWMITGAGRGLGRAFAAEAVRNGDRVIATVRRPAQRDPLFENPNVLPVRMDVTKTDEIRAAVREGLRRFGRIDVLVNNVGFGLNGAFEEISDEELRDLMETNYFGVVNVTREVLPVMRSQKSGRILNISSQAGAMGSPGNSAYCASKYAVIGLSDALRTELVPFGIQTAAVLPGAFRTDFRDGSSMKHAVHLLSAYNDTPVRGRRAYLDANNHRQPGDPAAAARFLYGIVQKEKLPSRILIGKECCEQIIAFLEDQIEEIASYADASARTAFLEG